MKTGGGIDLASGHAITDSLPPERENLVTENIRLVDFVLHKRLHIKTTHEHYEEYRSEGYVGLVKAAISYDESYGTKFSTHAVPYIQGYIMRFQRDFMHNSMKVSRNIIDNYVHILQLSSDGLSYEEIAEKLNISMYDIRVALESKDSGISLNGTISPDEDSTLSNIIGFNDPAIEAIESEEFVIESIERVASKLSDTYKNIWYDFVYPAYCGDHIVETDLAKKYGVSQPQISRILRRCKGMLAKEIGYTESFSKRGRPRR